MANRWGIPKHVEFIVLERDKKCVYCGVDFDLTGLNRKTRKTWEHIINDIRINDESNIALCCASCNASKGNKLLSLWLEGRYCLNKNINFNTVSNVVQEYLSSL